MIPNVQAVKHMQYKSSIFCKSITLLGNVPSHLNKELSYKSFCDGYKKFVQSQHSGSKQTK